MSGARFDRRLMIHPPLTREQLAELDHARRLQAEVCNRRQDWRSGWFRWEVSDDGHWLTLVDGVKFVTDATDAVEQLINDWLRGWGCSVSGEARWEGGGESDTLGESGVIYADRNRVEAVWDEIVRTNHGPWWTREAANRSEDKS